MKNSYRSLIAKSANIRVGLQVSQDSYSSKNVTKTKYTVESFSYSFISSDREGSLLRVSIWF